MSVRTIFTAFASFLVAMGGSAATAANGCKRCQLLPHPLGAIAGQRHSLRRTYSDGHSDQHGNDKADEAATWGQNGGGRNVENMRECMEWLETSTRAEEEEEEEEAVTQASCAIAPTSAEAEAHQP